METHVPQLGLGRVLQKDDQRFGRHFNLAKGEGSQLRLLQLLLQPLAVRYVKVAHLDFESAQAQRGHSEAHEEFESKLAPEHTLRERKLAYFPHRQGDLHVLEVHVRHCELVKVCKHQEELSKPLYVPFQLFVARELDRELGYRVLAVRLNYVQVLDFEIHSRTIPKVNLKRFQRSVLFQAP